jgi:hypothetical protein
MAAEIFETTWSRESRVDFAQPSTELAYLVIGTEDDSEVMSLVEATAPPFYNSLTFKDYTIKHMGGGVWDCKAHYNKSQPTYTFDTTGSTEKTVQSIQTRGSFGRPIPAAPPSDFKGAIGVNWDTVEGTEIYSRAFKWTETYYLSTTDVSGLYQDTIYALTSTYNQDVFRNFAPGQVLFIGARGSQRGLDDWEISFNFSALPNVTGLTIGDITGISKMGWDYLWIRYMEKVDGNRLVKVADAVYVEQVYYPGDFSQLNIGS